LRPRVLLAGKMRGMDLSPELNGAVMFKALRMTEPRFLKRMIVILPSAPPFFHSGQDTNQVVLGSHNEASANSHGASNTNEPNVPNVMASGANQEDCTGNKVPRQQARTTAGAKFARSFGSHSARLPTFRAR
ncbi:hypothetical protein SOVF_196840, partial [Spinacia oleracea]